MNKACYKVASQRLKTTLNDGGEKKQGRIHGNPVADGWAGAVMQQVTRGHNIVADGWAGAYNPHPYPPPPHTHTQTIITAASKMRVFTLLDSIIMDQRTDRRTNAMDGPTYGQGLL